MLSLRHLSIKRKLTIIVMLTCAITLLSACILFVVTDRMAMKESMVHDLTVLADIIGANSTAAITFQSQSDAFETLAALRAESHIISACIFTINGENFAFYFRNDSFDDIIPNQPESEGYVFGNNSLTLFREIKLNDKTIGTIYLKSDLVQLQTRMNRYIKTVALVMLVSLIIAFAIISRLQRVVSKPINHLADVARDVSTRQDYSLRASLSTHDEVGFLIEKFNEMLSYIQERDSALQDAHDGLEERVKERTVELENEINERKHAELALRESETRFRHLFNTFYDAIFIVKEDKFIDCNARTLEMFNCTRDQIIGKQPYLFSPEFQPDGRKSKEKALDIIMATYRGEPQFFEWTHCTVERVNFDAEVSLNRLDLGSEQLIIAYVKDITDRKKAEKQEKELQEKLERAQRMESLGVLAGGVAHDLNNMLGPLVGYPELILEQLPDDSPVRMFAKRIGKSARDAADVIQDLLSLARRGRYEMEPTNINDVVNDYFESFNLERLSNEHPDINIMRKLNPNIPQIHGSSPHLSKVIMNLIVNAYDATPSGGSIFIETDLIYLEKLISGYNKVKPGEYVVLRVSDTGTGIDPEDIDSIFEPYYSKKKMGRSGSGLGLSVVYGIVKDHNGYYDIVSEVGKGTEFLLYFPVNDKLAPEVITEKKPNSGTESVLVIDDEEHQRHIASALLSSLGYQVETAANGRKAVEYLKTHSVDILVLDMIMENDFDGLDTYREIIKIHPTQKAIIASGFSTTRRVDEMQKLGAGQYIRKPYTRDSLSQAIREELDKVSSSSHTSSL